MQWEIVQQNFLDNFYQGITDPDTKISMLIDATGGGQVSFHATGFNKNGKIKSYSNSEILTSLKIKLLEHELLVLNNLLKPVYL